MAVLGRLVPSTWKGRAVVAVVTLLLLGMVSQLVRAWWLRGVSAGRKTGVLKKISRKGSPLCRYWLGELLVSNPALFGAPTELWEFTIDAVGDTDPFLRQLQEAESSSRRISIEYRQDKGRWWACSPNEFHVTSIAK